MINRNWTGKVDGLKMLTCAQFCVGLLTVVLHMSKARVIYSDDEVFLQDQAAVSFLSRNLLFNSWDFELIAPDNLERECKEEVCTYEEARETFEDDVQTALFWEKYTTQGEAPRVDVSGLVAGILALVVIAVIATVLGCYCYKARAKPGRGSRRAPVMIPGNMLPPPEGIPLTGIVAPGLPSYNEALARSGQHDAPPPPYSGGAPSEAPEPAEEEAEVAE
ncbi:hypothetical protein GJAV_G00217100 [Gymnothorax javanicus]|nr:hypothetical protein GJAV_G00217100 [Gymnothorax javanicus]